MTRPAGVPHPLSWVRRLDTQPWHGGEPPSWGLVPARELDERELAFELAYCAVDLDLSLAEAAAQLGIGQQRAQNALDLLRVEAAPRRRGSGDALTDSAIFKRLARERRRTGRVCIAPGCEEPIAAAKRLGTYACSARCRKRIFNAGGREALLERQRQTEAEVRAEQARQKAAARLPAASPLVVHCARCGTTFEGAAARAAFAAHHCPASDSS
jgi:hypothetical protein